MTPRPAILVVDDGVLVREGIRLVLEEGGFDVVGVVGDVEELFAALARLPRVDGIVLDIRMPPTHTDEGLRALERLRGEGSARAVLLLSMYGNPSLAIRAAAGGARTGYLLKDRVTDGGMLAAAMRTLLDGGTVVDGEVVEMMLAARSPRGVDRLSEREHQVLALMAEGMSNIGIAARLFLSPKTVETHVGTIMTKLGIDATRAEHRRVLAVLHALRASDTA